MAIAPLYIPPPMQTIDPLTFNPMAGPSYAWQPPVTPAVPGSADTGAGSGSGSGIGSGPGSGGVMGNGPSGPMPNGPGHGNDSGPGGHSPISGDPGAQGGPGWGRGTPAPGMTPGKALMNAAMAMVSPGMFLGEAALTNSVSPSLSGAWHAVFGSDRAPAAQNGGLGGVAGDTTGGRPITGPHDVIGGVRGGGGGGGGGGDPGGHYGGGGDPGLHGAGSDPHGPPGSHKVGGRIDGYARGGTMPQTPWFIRSAAREVYHNQGLFHSAVPGRTDRINASVPGGSYVVPADVVSGLGEGNTLAGAGVLDKMMHSGPFGMKLHMGHGSSIPRAPHALKFADGGRTSRVPIVVAGGEYLVHPDDVRRVGEGSIDQGHDRLDHFVKIVRTHTAKKLKALPGPKKD